MTTQRQRARDAAAAAARGAEAELSIDSAENEGLPILAPTAGMTGTESDSALHALIDRSDVQLASVVPTPSTDRFPGQPARAPGAKYPRQIGAFRFRPKSGSQR